MSLMAGMLQILTYLLAFYLVVKGVEILQIGLASTRQDRHTVIILGSFMLLLCVVAAIGFTVMQDNQAQSLSAQPKSPLTPGEQFEQNIHPPP